MSSYDFTAASEFLDGIGATPQEIKDEIDRVTDDIKRSRIFTMQNTRILGLLSVFADFIERITPKEERRTV